jgi:hypothetical protein
MTEVSVVEILVYAIICYAGLLGIILSAFREMPQDKKQSGLRAIWRIPSMIAAAMLASLGTDINLEDSTVTSVTKNLNSTETWSETVTTNSTITLINPVWVTLHYLFFAILLVYILINFLIVLGKV